MYNTGGIRYDIPKNRLPQGGLTGKAANALTGRTTGKGRTLLLAAALVVLTSQIYISLYAGTFPISVAIVLLPVMRFLSQEVSVWAVAAVAAPGVFLLRVLFQGAENAWAGYGPEMLFYLNYGALLALYLHRVPLRPVRLVKFLPLVAVDALSNLTELLARMGTAGVTATALLQLVAVGAARSLLAWAVIRMLDAYSFQVLRREDAERYQRLLLMTAALKGEVAWMDKGTALIESTMNSAYRLYSQLRDGGRDAGAADTALTVAKDIHEVKKEYFLIMRGISEALDAEEASPGMAWRELADILRRSAERSARSLGKTAQVTCRGDDDFYTRRHHYLMSIFHNLLTNAVEAAPEGGTARLTLAERREGKDFFFEVADDCGGIPPQRLDQIFNPGFSSKINFATGEINRGLGLTIVRDLVEEKLKGSLTVSSQNGGTVFTIRIPAEELEETK